MATTRLRLGAQLRGPRGELLNQLSFIAVLSLSVAAIAFFGTRLGLRYGLLRSEAAAHRPVAARHVAEVASAPQLPGDVDIPTPDPGEAVPAVVSMTPDPKGGVYLPVLMYHYIRVAPKGDTLGYRLSVTPANFAAQMAWLSSHGYTPVTMRDAVQFIEKKRPAPERPIALTFDDAYDDFYSSAAPILRQYGFTATSYVPTRLVGLPGYMTWDQVVELDQQGFEMAAHTQFHVGLGRANLTRARTEIFGSLDDLESHLGHPVSDFCYPYGSFDPAVVKLVKEAGFDSATTTLDGAYHDTSQLFQLTRVRADGGESLDYWVRTFAPTNHAWPAVTSFGAASPPPSASARPSASPSPSRS